PASGPSAAAASNQTASTANLRLRPTTSRERMLSREAFISLYQFYTRRIDLGIERVARSTSRVLKLYRDGSNSIQEVIHAHPRHYVGSDSRRRRDAPLTRSPR